MRRGKESRRGEPIRTREEKEKRGGKQKKKKKRTLRVEKKRI